MNIRGLRAFVSVMANGSLLSAAREMNTSVSALSRQVSMLEDELDLQLFSRENRRLTPTARAYAFLPEVERLLASFDQMPTIAADIKRLPTRRLRIGAMPRMANCLVEPVVAAYMKKVPTADVTIETGPRHHLERGLLEQKIDIAFGSLPVSHEAISTETICRLPAVLIVHPSHRYAGRKYVTIADLAEEEFITLPPQTLLGRTSAQLFAEVGLSMKSRLQVTQTMSHCNLVAQGYGVAISDTMIPRGFRGGITILEIRPTYYFELGVFSLEGSREQELNSDLVDAIREAASSFH